MKSYPQIGGDPPIYGLPMGQEFSVNTATLGLVHGRFSLSASAVLALVEMVRLNPENDKAIIQFLIHAICYLEQGPHSYKALSLTEVKMLSDVELESISAAILSAVPNLEWLPQGTQQKTIPMKLVATRKLGVLAKTLRAWLGVKLSDYGQVEFHPQGLGDVFSAVVQNANTSVTVSDLARSIGDRPKAVKVYTTDSDSARGDIAGRDLSHMVTAPATPNLDELLAEARKATDLQAKTAEMMVSLNNVIVTLSNRYTHDQTQAQTAARNADRTAREKDRRDFAWVRGALFVTVFLGVVSIGIAIAALMNDYAGGDEVKAEAEQTREAIEAAGQAQSAALVRALQALQDQQAGDAKLSRDQIQQLIDEARRPLPAVTPARGAAAKPK